MREYWIYIESFVFIREIKSQVLLYNTYSYENIVFEKKGKLKIILEKLLNPENLRCVLITEKEMQDSNISNFISLLRNFYLGDIINRNISETKPLILAPTIEAIKDYKVWKSENITENGINVMEYLFEVSVYHTFEFKLNCNHCASAYLQFISCTKDSSKTTLNPKNVSMIISQLENSCLARVNVLGGDIFSLTNFTEIVDLYNKLKVQKFYYVFYDNLQGRKINFDNFDDKSVLRVQIVPENLKVDEIIQTINIISINKEIEFIIMSDNHVKIAKQIESQVKESCNFIYTPFFNANNIEFFNRYVFLTKNEIKLIKKSKQELFASQLLNSMFFGKLIIKANLDVYSNIHSKSLGNIKEESLQKIIFREIKDGKFWRKTRNSEPCSECLYNNICPPISNYEIILNRKNLCIQDK